MNQAQVTASQFSFKLSMTASELFLGGLNSAQYIAGSTVWYPVVQKGYWMIKGNAMVGTTTVLGGLSCIIDTGTSVVVVS